MNWICLVETDLGNIMPIVGEDELAMQWSNFKDAKKALAGHQMIRAYKHWVIDLDNIDYETIEVDGEDHG